MIYIYTVIVKNIKKKMKENSQIKFDGIWKKENKIINVHVSILIFEENGNTIVYCPALDISGYGKNEIEALDSFKVSTTEYLNYTTNKKTLEEDLVLHGWKLPKHKRQHIQPPLMSDLLSSNHEFARIFNNFQYKKIDKELSIPA
jgi:hypothetical protein